MRIKTLRASGTALIAEVGIGTDDKSNIVTLNIKLDRLKNDELAVAMAPLEALLVTEAEDRVKQACDNAKTRRRTA